ncbi:hypothetical protein V8D89_009679 [Ganoderma adspersum]
MHSLRVACDASGRTLRDVRSQLRNWSRRRARTLQDDPLGDETRASDDTPLVGGLHVRATNGPPTTTANAAGIPEASPTSATQDPQPSTTNSGIVPAVIAVVIFVVGVFVILRILRAIRRNRLVVAYTAELETPRMWEVRLDTAVDPSFEGKWNEVMPLAAQPQRNISSRSPPSRGMFVPTDVSGSQSSGRDSGDSNRRLLPLTFRKGAVSPVDNDYALPGHVVVLIAMPTPNRHISIQGEQPNFVGPICIGVVDM